MNLEEAHDWCGGDPSEVRFQNLCRRLGDGEISPAVLSRLLLELESWPQEIPRWAPEAWLEAARGQGVSALRLCTHLRLSQQTQDLERLLVRPELEHIHTLELEDVGDALVRAFFGTRSTFFLQTLILRSPEWKAASLIVLLRSHAMLSLRTLRVHGAGQERPLQELVRRPVESPFVQTLSLHDMKIGWKEGKALTDAPWFKLLSTLDLREVDLDPQGRLTFETMRQIYHLKVRFPEERPFDDASFGELRALLQQPPTEQIFAEVGQRLGSVDPSPATLRYLHDHITRWPQDVRRVAPKAWVHALIRGKEIAAFSLCDTVDISPRALRKRLDVGGATLDTLFRAPNMPTLRHFLLDGDHLAEPAGMFLSTEAYVAMAACEKLQELETLHLERAHLDDDGLEALARSPYLRSVRSLRLSYNHIRGPGIRALARSEMLATLESLCLEEEYESWINEAWGAEHFGIDNLLVLFASPRLASLKHLRLDLLETHDEFEKTGIAPLLETPCFQGLESLDVQRVPAAVDTCARLAASPHMRSMRVLKLDYGALGNAGMAHLASSPHLGRLEALHLEAIEPDWSHEEESLDEGVRALATSTHLPSLKRLVLNGEYTSREALNAVLTSTTLPQGARVECYPHHWFVGQPLSSDS